MHPGGEQYPVLPARSLRLPPARHQNTAANGAVEGAIQASGRLLPLSAGWYGATEPQSSSSLVGFGDDGCLPSARGNGAIRRMAGP